MRKYPDRLVENNKGRTTIPPPGGGVYRDWEKNCLLRKNAEINCLPKRYIWKKIVCRNHLCYARFGEFKKNCLHSQSGGKKLASAQSMVEKISCLPEITIPPSRGKNNGQSLKRLLDVSSTHIRFVGD